VYIRVATHLLVSKEKSIELRGQELTILPEYRVDSTTTAGWPKSRTEFTDGILDY